MKNKEMIMEEIRQYIYSVLKDKFYIDELNSNELDYNSNLFEELRAFDSIDALELLVTIEDHYDLNDSYDEDGIEFLQSIQSISEYVYKRKFAE